jgi:hypothetical protein
MTNGKGLGFETIPNMSKVIFYCWFFYIFLKGQILGDVPFDRNLHIPFLLHPTKIQKHKHGGCTQFQLPPCFSLHA